MLEAIQKIEDRWAGPVLERLRSRRWATAIAAGNLAIIMSGANYLALDSQHDKPCVERTCRTLPPIRTVDKVVTLPSPLKHHETKKSSSPAPPKPTPTHTPPPPTQAPKPPKTSPSPKPLRSLLSLAESPSMAAHALVVAHPPDYSMLGRPGEQGGDVSHPNCDRSLPSHVGFAIVGLNEGYPGRPNHCLQYLLHWAASATHRDQVPVYINVADPGPSGNLWPHSTADPSGTAAPNPYGYCHGGNTPACAWQYGYNMAWRADNQYFRPAAKRAGIRPSLAGIYAFVDVEYEGDGAWQGGEAGRQLNADSLSGTVAYLGRIGAHPGIYSHPNAWGGLVGPVAKDSPLHGLPLWIPTGGGDDAWREACHTPSFNGGEVILTQTVKNGMDTDLRCAS